MALQSDHQKKKKPLLYADLFKSSASPEENSSWISTSPSDSSSSSFTSPLQYSDFDDEDFIENLTRQVTECMLDEEEEEEEKVPPIQVYELKNQPTVKTKRLESAKEKVLQRHMMQYGSGMQAVYLGGPGSKKMPPGTGVFLPDPTRRKNKSAGCSMVLIPTRVLQTLDLHFKQRHQSGGRSQLQSSPTADESRQLEQVDDEIQLPQEWTY